MVLSISLTFLSSIITARLLGPSDYGDLKYIQTVWSLATLVITFGYFYSGSRVLVLESDNHKCREISGTIVLISLLMGILISLIIVAIAYPLDKIFHIHVTTTMATLAPLLLVLPLSQSLPLILQSTNQIYLLAVFNAVPPFLYLLAIVELSGIKSISTRTVLFSQQLTMLIVVIVVLIYIKPSFKSVKFWWGELQKHHKTFGVPVYRGSLFSVGTSYLSRLAIAYWADNTAIGFYSLANSLVEPLKLLPNAIATSSFRSFATQPRISNKIILPTIILSVATLVIAFMFFGAPLSWIYTTRFDEVGPMARALSLGAIFLGFGDLFNRFLGAHGKGKSLQNAAYGFGITNLVGMVIFVPLLGAWGAVLTAILAGGVYLIQMVLSYRNFTHQPIQQ